MAMALQKVHGEHIGHINVKSTKYIAVTKTSKNSGGDFDAV